MADLTHNEHDREESRQSDLAVMSQAEYKDKRRLESILDAIAKVEVADDATLVALTSGNIEPDGRNFVIFQRVQSAIRECYNMLRRHAEQAENEVDGYWRTETPIARISFDSGEDVELYGLSDFLNAKPLHTRETVETVKRRNMPFKEETKTETKLIPARQSLQAFLLLKKFLSDERGLELKFEAQREPLEV